MQDTLNEYTEVELPLIEQLSSMGWQYIEGDTNDPTRTERERFRDVLLLDRLRHAIRRINLDPDGQPWLDDERIDQAVGALTRLGTHKLIEANQHVTDLLISGTVVEGDADLHAGREQQIAFIDYDHPDNNDFLAINQFRVDPPWATGDRNFIVPDVVLFVNGIPLVVIECKHPGITHPIGEGITQLLRYSNQREDIEVDEGAEALFHYNQLMIATSRYQARVGAVCASYSHYMKWKDTCPTPLETVKEELGVEHLTAQHILVAGMLRKECLLDIVRNFTLFNQSSRQTIKIVPRYQQFRAVQKAIHRLQTGKTRLEHGDTDERGGIIWHTQGSGKSITMVFLVRKLRTLPDLRRFKVVVITDRTDLEKQLSETATLTGETVRKATKTARLKQIVAEDGPDLVFGMIQKYQERDVTAEVVPFQQSEERATELLKVAEEQPPLTFFPVLNESESILVLIDEAHRSHANTLHANLLASLPNCARIGFTGTPIIMGAKKKTHEIFGSFIDTYKLRDAERDGMIVPLLYEGRTTDAVVSGSGTLDHHFEDMFHDRTPKELEAIKRKYATHGVVLEAEKLIAAKAENILYRYIDQTLPDGFKAMVVATSRLAAIRYQAALTQAQQELIRKLEGMDSQLLELSEAEQTQLDTDTQFLIRASAHLKTIRRLEFATVISAGTNDNPAWGEWSNKAKINTRIERFRKPLREDGLAFLCVQGMLLTGFDAPIAQVLYLDRSMQGHELLQAIARVNRTCGDKKHGLIVDYCGIAHHLHEALEAYSQDDVEGTMADIRSELPKLEGRYRKVLALFQRNEIESIHDHDACVELLCDIKIRAEFITKFKAFLEKLNTILPRPEGLPYASDAKVLGFINKAAANLYRDPELNIMGVGNKVRKLIDEHIVARGINPTIPPISVLDANFVNVVESHTSP